MNFLPFRALVREPWFRVLTAVGILSIILSVGALATYPWAFLGTLITVVAIVGVSAKLYFFFVYGDVRAALLSGVLMGLALLAIMGLVALSYTHQVSALASFPV